MATRQAVLTARPQRRAAPGGRQLALVVVAIVLCAAVAGVVAMRARQEQERLAHRHRIEAQVRDTQVVDTLRSEIANLAQVAPPAPGLVPEPEAISAAMRPGLPVTIDDLLPEAVDFAITSTGPIGSFDGYVVDTDRFAERSVDLYGGWLSSTELIPVDPFAALRVPHMPHLTRGEVFVAVDADDDGTVNRVVVIGDDPIFANAAVFESDR